jgi:cell division control protein 7
MRADNAPRDQDDFNFTVMAKARTSLRTAEHIDVHEDDIKEEDAEETLDESMDPLDESGHTVDSSDEEEVEDTVQEDMARFEETFVGITKRFRLINRIGEGMS